MSFDQQTRNLQRSCLRLSEGLLFAPQLHQGNTYYHIENSATAKFYRIRYAQYTFISLLDGRTSFSAALALTAQDQGANALTEEEAIQLVQWLLRNKLAVFADESSISTVNQVVADKSILQHVNPFWMKLPLGSPDEILSVLLPYCRWMFHPAVWLVAAFVYVYSLTVVLNGWERFASEIDTIFSPSNWLWMLAAWVVLKVVHELAHGMTCKYFGGSVRDTGLIFILFAPMAYVDVTSAWRFPSKWHRVWVASAGMAIELLIAAIAILVWSRTESEMLSQWLHNLILMAGVSTVLFNANPLMRFDGYFILSDLLEIPNLFEEGTKQAKQTMAWLFLGRSTQQSQELTVNHGQRWFVWIYGMSASCWKLVICATLLIGASTMFRGAGIVMGAMGTLLWFGAPMREALRTLINQYFESRTSFIRAVVVLAGMGVGIWSLWAVVPNPASLQLPCIVDFEKAAFVRASAPGFLEEVLVCDGQFVEQGTPLVRLQNELINVEVKRLKSDLKRSQLRARIARDLHDPAAVQVELEKQRSIGGELDDKLEQLSSLMIVAPIDGRVVARELENRIGTYFSKGDDLLVLGNDSKKELVVSVSEENVKDVLPRIGDSLHARIGSRSGIMGTLVRIDPRASTSLPHAAFAATVGGPVPVRARAKDEGNDNSSVEFAAPRFSGVVSLTATEASRLFSGERGQVRLGRSSETLGRWAVKAIQKFVESHAKVE